MSTQKKIYCLVLSSGLAALSWEVLWQIKAALALGVSAWGTAITLACTMGGMAAGALLAGHILRNKTIASPLKTYAVLEMIIGLCGLMLTPGFQIIENIDTSFYQNDITNGSVIHLTGIVVILGIPTMCMGATIPVLGLLARQAGISVASVYGFNTLGAAAGTLAAALLVIPFLGVTHATWLIASINIMVAATAWILRDCCKELSEKPVITAQISHDRIRPHMEWVIVAVTGFSTFVLEIAWFRSLTAAFNSTTIAFAIMLSAVLIALGLGAHLAPWLKKYRFSLGIILTISGCLILAATPIVERLDLLGGLGSHAGFMLIINKFILTLSVLGLPMMLMGVALPWILDSQNTARRWGFLYALNAFSAILGALVAAWIMLPTIGMAKTAWVAGILVVISGLMMLPRKQILKLSAPVAIALLVAIVFESGVGTTRSQGWKLYKFEPKAVLKSVEGPDVTTSVIEYKNGMRVLLIDGFAATGQSKEAGQYGGEHYMIWMGHLPMLLHPNPENALVICFGTGQTANAVLKENPKSLDIVDINRNVFAMADYFPSNEKVLDDERVRSIVMDGRAYMRRTNKKYDIITLEPMPPTFAGVNALYSHEFYELAWNKLNEGGIIAQWLPYHLVDIYQALSIAKTFQDVFPNSVLWLDPLTKTGIILGSKSSSKALATSWPGFSRNLIQRTMSEKDIREAIIMSPETLSQYSRSGSIITDNNQALAYRKVGQKRSLYMDLNKDNHDYIEKALTQNE